MASPTSLRMDIAMIISFQIVLVILFGLFTDYEDRVDPSVSSTKSKAMNVKYSMFQDVHVMIFIGFGFLMTFLKRYGYSAVGFNLLLASLMIQWATVCRGFFAMEDGKVKISLKSLMGADIAAASVLISMGAVLGKTTFLQLIVMGTFEVVIFAANEYLLLDILKITDVGGSIVVHTFGAYFGLAVSFMLRPKPTTTSTEHELEGASYHSDLFAMIGTIFLWVFWPSFNGGLVSGDQQFRAITNTYLSLASCSVTAFCLSSLTSPHKKLDMVHVQNSTLAGGVVVGAVCNLMLQPYGAVLAGMGAGAVSVLGYKYLTPLLNSSLRLHDTCGVHNLHGMPGVLSGLLAALLAWLATEASYQQELYSIFPAMNPTATNIQQLQHASYDNGTDVAHRSSGQQASYQLLGLIITLALAVVTGAITGLVLKAPFIGQLPDSKKFDDDFSWELPATPSSATTNNQNHGESTKNASHNNYAYEQDITLETV